MLTEGKVEILNEDENVNTVLNEIEPPQIFGEISFLMKGVKKRGLPLTCDI